MSGCVPAAQAGLVGVRRARSARERPLEASAAAPARCWHPDKQPPARPAELGAKSLEGTSAGILVGAWHLKLPSAPSLRTCIVAVAMVEVKIRSVDGTTDSVSVDDLSSTIRDVKLAIEAAKSYPVETQRLVFRGKVLQDDKTLAEYCECGRAAWGWPLRPRCPAPRLRQAHGTQVRRGTCAAPALLPAEPPLLRPAPLAESIGTSRAWGGSGAVRGEGEPAAQAVRTGTASSLSAKAVQSRRSRLGCGPPAEPS